MNYPFWIHCISKNAIKPKRSFVTNECKQSLRKNTNKLYNKNKKNYVHNANENFLIKKKNFSNENYSMQMLNIQLKWKFVNTNKNHTLKI